MPEEIVKNEYAVTGGPFDGLKVSISSYIPSFTVLITHDGMTGEYCISHTLKELVFVKMLSEENAKHVA
jgi:hypothetical protein